jgi:hypothetical protein
MTAAAAGSFTTGAANSTDITGMGEEVDGNFSSTGGVVSSDAAINDWRTRMKLPFPTSSSSLLLSVEVVVVVDDDSGCSCGGGRRMEQNNDDDDDDGAAASLRHKSPFTEVSSSTSSTAT